MSSTREILARMGSSLAALGVGTDQSDPEAVKAAKSLTPTVPTTADLAGDHVMNHTQVESMVDLTVSQSGWLSSVSVKLRGQRAGTIPRLSLNDTVTEGVDENAGATVASRPDLDEVDYNCRKFQATWYLTLEDIGEARASGEADFDGKVRRAFGKAMGNDMARWFLRGDTSLAATSRENRLLRQRDGILVQARARANYRTTTRGTTWTRTVYPAMKRRMPAIYKDDPNLRWFLPSDLDEDFTNSLMNLGDGAALRDQALTERRRYAPMGIPPVLVPQWPTDQGFATLNGSTAAADTVTDNGDGTATFRVNTVLGGYAAGNAGRVIRVTCDATGQYEDLTVEDVGGHNVATTAGSLGQGSISTTAADYTLDLADCTGAMLTNPANLFLVLCRNIRAYRKFEQEAERWRVDVYYEADAGIFQPDALVLQEGIVPTQITFGS